MSMSVSMTMSMTMSITGHSIISHCLSSEISAASDETTHCLKTKRQRDRRFSALC